MRKDSLTARRKAESLSLREIQDRPNSFNSDMSLGGEFDEADRLSLGSSCCGTTLFTKPKGRKTYCSSCQGEAEEVFETDEEFEERMNKVQEEKEERLGYIDEAYGSMDDGGY